MKQRRWCWLKPILVLLALPLAPPPSQVGATEPATLQPANEIWFVDSRRAVPGELTPRLSFYRFDSGLWIRSTETEFVATSDISKPTCFWVHGNRVSDADAVDRGLRVFGHLAARATRPFRFVLWSWPSTEIQGPLRDVQVKAQISDVYAWPLAHVIDRIDPRVETSFLGYSYGARLICGALHLQQDRQVTARGISSHNAARRAPTRVVLLAAAMDDTSFLPGGRNQRALRNVGQMLITVNRHDPAMKWYRMLYGSPGPQALGYSGAAGIIPPTVSHLDVSETLGANHALAGYLGTADFAKWLGL